MTNEKYTVALIFGGRGCEHDISIEGASFFYDLLDESSYEIIPVYISKNSEWLMPAEPCEDILMLPRGKCKARATTPAYKDGESGLLFENGFIKLDAAVPLLHGDFGEDGIVQGALENAGISFVGCDTLTGAVLSDKAYTKIIAEYLGVPTVPWILTVDDSAAEARAILEEKIGYPAFIKPARLGSSIGAALVTDARGFENSYGFAARLGGGRVLIEKYIDVDKELECAYFKGKSKELFTKAGEISTNSGFYDYETKYESCTATVRDCADVGEDILENIERYSRLLVSYLGIRDLSRIDFFLSKDGVLYFNEINSFPGFTESSLYPRLIARAGVSPRELARELVEAARLRGN